MLYYYYYYYLLLLNFIYTRYYFTNYIHKKEGKKPKQCDLPIGRVLNICKKTRYVYNIHLDYLLIHSITYSL